MLKTIGYLTINFMNVPSFYLYHFNVHGNINYKVEGNLEHLLKHFSFAGYCRKCGSSGQYQCQSTD